MITHSHIYAHALDLISAIPDAVLISFLEKPAACSSIPLPLLVLFVYKGLRCALFIYLTLRPSSHLTVILAGKRLYPSAYRS